MASHHHHHDSKHAHREPLLSDKPIPSSPTPNIGWGSDAIAYQLAHLDLKYIALVPGSSYRGLHDSIVNFSGNNPEMLVTLHEEHAVSIAHGYAKITGKPMAAGVHANVGLLHATMGIYNAYTDRVPVVILGATGPLDSTKRRPWIDWIHTAQDQGALIRNYVKFDDQPHGVNAAVESLLHATVAAASKPCAPTYVCLDLGLQESKIEDASSLTFPETRRYLNAIAPAGPSIEDVMKVIAALSESKRPLFMLGRMRPTQRHWEERIALIEKFDARVISDIKQTAPFPFPHRLQPSAPGVFISPQTSELIRDADLIISFDWVDLAGNLKAAGAAEPHAKVVSISLDSVLHNGWSKDHFAISPADISIFADVDKTMEALLTAAGSIEPQRSHWPETAQPTVPPEVSPTSQDIFISDLASALYTTFPPSTISLVRVPLGWQGLDLRATHALSFMGMDGGAGIGSGPGQVVGTSLALHSIHSDLTAVAILGDGEYLMASSALWTAARYKLPLLVIVANNGSYYNDEVHQENVAKTRGRETGNKWIGMRLDEPQPNLHLIAEGHGLTVVRKEQVKEKGDLEKALQDAKEEVRKGKAVVLDVRVLPKGYGEAMTEKSTK